MEILPKGTVIAKQGCKQWHAYIMLDGEMSVLKNYKKEEFNHEQREYEKKGVQQGHSKKFRDPKTIIEPESPFKKTQKQKLDTIAKPVEGITQGETLFTLE